MVEVSYWRALNSALGAALLSFLLLADFYCGYVDSSFDVSTKALTRLKRYCTTCGCNYCQQQSQYQLQPPPPQYPVVPQYQNPCLVGIPILAPTGLPQFCRWDQPSCPSNYFCHVGFTPATTCCCQQMGADPCQQPMTLGEGNSILQRWYYDFGTRQCQSFTYQGMKGNQNNFLSRDLCQTACRVIENPCEHGNPAPGATGGAQYCSPTPPSGCIIGNWCHVGVSQETTVCCPGSGQECIAPMNPGTGNGNLARWWFNPQARMCQPFIYRGMKGNQNNHQSRVACEQICNPWQNVCPFGDPVLVMNRPQVCSPMQACGAGYWCHLGATPETTMCCLQTGNPCSLPAVSGNGTGTITRWFFDANARTCQTFIYRGLHGNENNFLTREACSTVCPEFEDPCMHPAILDPSGRPTRCGFGAAHCQTGSYCHIGLSPDTTICCPRTGTEICALPMLIGSVSIQQAIGAPAQRWYYDPVSRNCQNFVYRGMKGNENNFITREACEAECRIIENPCPSQSPTLDSGGQPIRCGFGGSQCQGGSWCHFGATAETTVCCPRTGDTCALPVAVGQGTATLQRWFFDTNARSCQMFTYRGMKGNENNFVTREACETICRVMENPCPTQAPVLDSSGQPIRCGFSGATCQGTAWCHIGTTPELTICCPRTGDPCALPVAQGISSQSTPTAPAQRWFYDPAARSCQNFPYRGMKGNENNFISREACEMTCHVPENPCPTQFPTLDANGQTIRCGFGGAQCQGGTWCHFGLSPDTTICCPRTGDPCALPMVQGQGTGSPQPRWYFDAGSRTCQQFQYRGMKGNENNFNTRESCEATCRPIENPCTAPAPSLDPTGRPIRCGFGGAQCQLGSWCHIGLTPDTTVCCPGPSPGCELPMLEGQGQGSMQRWYFNSQVRRCEQFNYRGSKGNSNNFLTREECRTICREISPCFNGVQPLESGGRLVQCSSFNENSCPSSHYCHVGAEAVNTVCCPRSGNPCEILPLIGNGNARLPRWAYNPEQDDCMPFTYSGMGGNENNFVNKADCERRCPGYRGYCPHGKPLIVGHEPQTCSIETACPRNFVCHVNTQLSLSLCCADPEFFCFLPVTRGGCSDNMQRYAYDPASDSCKPFQYTGCGGNMNNFESFELCTKLCCKQPPLPGQLPPGRDRGGFPMPTGGGVFRPFGSSSAQMHAAPASIVKPDAKEPESILSGRNFAS